MTNPATTLDIEARWRPLDSNETINGQTFLDDAWRMLRRKVADLETRIADVDEPDLEGEVIRVIVTAVLRVMKNPDGMRQESQDDASWTRDQAVASGLLYFMDEELDDLAVVVDGSESRGGAFSFDLLGADYPDARFPDGA